MDTNEKLIKITSKLPIDSELNLGDEIQINYNNFTHTLVCVKKEYKDNQDGTQDAIYSLKLFV